MSAAGARVRRDPADAAELAARVLTGTPLIDGHNDLPSGLRLMRGYDVAGLDAHNPEFHTDIPRLRAGMVGAQFWSLWVPPALPEPEALLATVEQCDAVYRLVAHYPDVFELARTAADVERIFRSGRIASLLGIEGGHSIAESLPALRAFARLGVRYLTLTHSDNIGWADSATDAPGVGGLTDLGRAVVAEMNRIGMLVDLSHVAESTQNAVLDVATAPVIFSHSSLAAVANHPRNVTDDVLARVVAGGGVVQVTFVPEFLSPAVQEWADRAAAERRRLDLYPPEEHFWRPAPKPGQTHDEVRAETARVDAADQAAMDPQAREEFARWREANPRPEVTLDDVVAHLEYARDVAGPEHVGIGGDYDGTGATPVGLEDVSSYPRLFGALAERGWSAAELAALAGGNVLRVLRAAEEAATERLFVR